MNKSLRRLTKDRPKISLIGTVSLVEEGNCVEIIFLKAKVAPERTYSEIACANHIIPYNEAVRAGVAVSGTRVALDVYPSGEYILRAIEKRHKF